MMLRAACAALQLRERQATPPAVKTDPAFESKPR